MSNNYFPQQDLQQLFPFGDILDLEASETQSLEAWFLGQKAENLAEFEGLILEAIRDQAFWRRNFYPGDPTQINEQVKRQPEYIQAIDTLKESYRSLLAFLKKSVPFFSMRYQGHMNWEVTMPAMLGYFAAMLYNPNNVAFEASTATTILEMLVGDDLCKMLGYSMPTRAEIDRGALRPWGHLTCGGTVANIEAIWSARNLKFYPLALQAVLNYEPEFIAAKYIEVTLASGKNQILTELDTWSLLNLQGDDILALPTRLQTEYQIDPDTIARAIAKYSLQNLGIQEFSRRFLQDMAASPVLIVPGTKHYSFAKTTALLGIGSSNIIDVPVDRDARLDSKQLDKILQNCLERKQPVYAVVAVMGSTEESAVDPLTDVLVLRDKYRILGLEFTVHADAAWGGYFASLLREDEPGEPKPSNSDKSNCAISMSDYATKQFAVLDRADSITVDPHKSGYIPYPAGALCYRNSAMRNLVTFAAPVVFHGGTEPSIGIYGIEGSKPGAAAAAVYLSHKVIRPTKSGYGKIHGQALFSCKKLYARLISMTRPKDWFVVVPVPRLPAEKKGGDIEREIQFIRDRIDGKSNEELLSDCEAMNLLAELGPDQNILTYAFNFRKLNGFLNTDLALANRLNKAIYSMLSINPGDDIYGYSLIVSTTDFSKADYGADFIENYKQRLGVADSPGDSITVLRSTVMNPWLTETAKGSFLDVIEQEFRQVVAKALFRDSLLQIFEEFDVNSNGVLEIEEIKTKFKELGYDERETENFWKMSDLNRDNSLSIPEFLNSFSQFIVLSSLGKKT